MSKLEKISTVVGIVAALIGIAGAVITLLPRDREASLENSAWKVCFHCTETSKHNYFVLGENREFSGFDQTAGKDLEFNNIDSIHTEEGENRGIEVEVNGVRRFFETTGNWHVNGDLLTINLFEDNKKIASVSVKISENQIRERLVGEGTGFEDGSNFPVEMNRIY